MSNTRSYTNVSVAIKEIEKAILAGNVKNALENLKTLISSIQENKIDGRKLEVVERKAILNAFRNIYSARPSLAEALYFKAIFLEKINDIVNSIHTYKLLHRRHPSYLPYFFDYNLADYHCQNN